MKIDIAKWFYNKSTQEFLKNGSSGIPPDQKMYELALQQKCIDRRFTEDALIRAPYYFIKNNSSKITLNLFLLIFLS